MLRIRKKMMITGLAVMMCVSALLAGCGASVGGNSENNTDLPQCVSMVMGVHEYFPTISLNTDSVYSQIYNACYSYGDVSAFIVDGDPYAVCNYNITAPDKKIDAAKRKQLASNNTKQIMAEMSAASAKTPEIDTLSAIAMSADTLHSTSGEAELSMIVYDSGLSTTSLLNFAAQNIIDEPVESIVSQLEAYHAIPNLESVHVVWIGLGQTCGEQSNLTADYKYKLQEIWKAILEAGGAGSVTFDKSPLSSEEYQGELPKCSVVPVVTDSLELAAAEEMPEIVKWDGNSNIQFLGDKAEFVNPDAVMEEIKPVVEYLTENSEKGVYVFGMTATIPGGDLGIKLSEARANACRDVLLAAGVKESQIMTVGLGQVDNPLRTPDVDETGRQIEEAAQKNRAVIFVKQGSRLVDTLMECAVK